MISVPVRTVNAAASQTTIPGPQTYTPLLPPFSPHPLLSYGCPARSDAAQLERGPQHAMYLQYIHDDPSRLSILSAGAIAAPRSATRISPPAETSHSQAHDRRLFSSIFITNTLQISYAAASIDSRKAPCPIMQIPWSREMMGQERCASQGCAVG